MPFVIDASMAASWMFPDERGSASLRAYARLAEEPAIVPHLWWYEVRNVFIMNERRERIDAEQTRTAIALLSELPIEFDHDCVEPTLFYFARQYRLTVYDAAYLELAARFTLPLATLDRAMASAARAERITVIGD